jgi:hypothetical protein
MSGFLFVYDSVIKIRYNNTGGYMRPFKIILSCIALIVSAIIVWSVHSGNQKTTISHGPTATAAPATIGDSDVLADAWIYPDDPKALTQLQKIGRLQAARIEFLHVADDGTLEQYDQSADYPNGYSAENVALLKKHSNEQYITVSGLFDGTQKAIENKQTIPKIVALANKTDFNVELDWEDFGSWTPTYCAHYKAFVTQLRQALQASGKKLAIDGPAIHDQVSQDWYQWKYEELTPLVDQVVMMVYDNQYDEGAGTGIAPEQWSLDCMAWLKQKAGTHKAIVGVAAYGYIGDTATNRIAVNTSQEVARRAQVLSVSRTADEELKAHRGTQFYVYADGRTMTTRLHQVEQSGFKHLSVWSLGSNPWFPEAE